MKIVKIENQRDIKQAEDTVLVLGYFDALHKGHQEMFKKAKQVAKEKTLQVAVLTFPESPRLTFARYDPSLLLHLYSVRDRFEKMEEMGVDVLYLINFTSCFANYTGREFVDEFIRRLRAKVLIAGFDYHFGRDKKSVQGLQEYFIGQVIILPPIEESGEKVSSTRLRRSLSQGNIGEVNKLLGSVFTTSGIVVRGDARGRTMGYPTANLALVDRVILPADGVYVVDVLRQERKYRGMASVGKNVTFSRNEMRFEVNIFNFNKEIYGESLKIFWLDRIRDMIRFDDISDLIQQLRKDKYWATVWKH